MLSGYSTYLGASIFIVGYVGAAILKKDAAPLRMLSITFGWFYSTFINGLITWNLGATSFT